MSPKLHIFIKLALLLQSVERVAGPSPQLSASATQLRRNITAATSRWRHCVRFNRPGNRIYDLPHGYVLPLRKLIGGNHGNLTEFYCQPVMTLLKKVNHVAHLLSLNFSETTAGLGDSFSLVFEVMERPIC